MRFDKAIWHGPVPNERSESPVRKVRGLVLHIMEGSITSCDNWFHNPRAEASAHFGNPKSGELWQWVDTDREAWAQMAGNLEWISVEHEGVAPEELTASQLENDARLLAWLHHHYGVPLQRANSPAGSGLGFHAMGGEAWGGHFGCPGALIVAQRSAIVARAKELVAPPAPPKFLIASHPGGGDALVNLDDRQWKGIPDPLAERVEIAKGIRRGSVPPLWWTHATQIPWEQAFAA
jgi:hypothetical protein